MKRRILSLCLAVLLVLTLFPVREPAQAAETTETVDYGLALYQGKIYQATYVGWLQKGAEITVPGLSYKDGAYVFDNFSFLTSCPYAVYICDASATVHLKGNNKIYSGDSDNYTS